MSVRNLFDGWAKVTKKKYAKKQWMLSKWENIEGIDWPKDKIDCMIESVAEGLDLRQSDFVVDLGCGGGWITKALSRYVDNIIGSDFSLEMLANSHVICPDVSFVCGNIGELPFKDGIAQRVLCYFVFINMLDDIDIQNAIIDIMRILTKGGKALIGQLPDKAYSYDYDEDKKEYLQYCRETFGIGKNCRDMFPVPQKLFDRAVLKEFLDKAGISYQFRDSFNPFYRDGQPKTINWRFDLILFKK
jgi:ubiquinone/menaquinone biosynthesis C-methylase UbiE